MHNRIQVSYGWQDKACNMFKGREACRDNSMESAHFLTFAVYESAMRKCKQ